MIQTSRIVLITAVAMWTSSALAVKTKHCPETITASIPSLDVDDSKIEPSDKDINLINIALVRLSKFTAVEDTMKITSRSKGVCDYKGSKMFAQLYTSKGRELAYVGKTLVQGGLDRASELRVYGRISLLENGELEIEPRDNYGAMIYFWGRPSLFYDGGMELRPVGSAQVNWN
jgi:hypothetical protein